MSTFEETIPVVLAPEPTETLSVPVNPPWRWRDVMWLVTIFLLAAMLMGVIYSVLLQQIGQNFPPAIQVSGVLIQVYLLLIGGVYWFTIRRAGASWAQLGIRRPRTSWMLAVPAIFVVQLMGIAFINLAIMGFFTSDGFENPQLDALEQALAVPSPEASITVPAESPSVTAPEKQSQIDANGALPADTTDTQIERLSRNVKLTIADLFWLILAIGIVAPFSEELFFRGMIYPLQRRKQKIWLAVLLNGLLFSVTHLIPILMPALFIIGIILAWVRERSGSIWPAFTLHMLQNSMAIYAIYTLVN